MSEPISAGITAQIVAARRRQGSTRDEVAAAAQAAGAPTSFTTAALRNLESGRRAPSVDELVWLAAALATPVRELLGEQRHLFGADVAVRPECGPVEDATRRAAEQLGALDGHEAALMEGAYVLARALDAGAGMATAAVHKEYRATLAALWEDRAGDEDDDDDEDLGPS
ncbi:helix-turn-helix transcriptional regulator [Micromonospora sp. CPCC 205371]|nr:helix-turn-helix transcriptional regulator [Micromonospora sp. CPCC 205371]